MPESSVSSLIPSPCGALCAINTNVKAGEFSKSGLGSRFCPEKSKGEASILFCRYICVLHI